MLLTRLAVLALLATCACLARAAEVPALDIDNNEVLPEKDLVHPREDKLSPIFTVTDDDDAPPSIAPEAADDKSPSSDSTTTATGATSSTASPSSPLTSEAAKDATPAPPTTQRPPSSLSQFLSDIIQIPVAVIRSVGNLLSSALSSHRNATTARNASATSA